MNYGVILLVTFDFLFILFVLFVVVQEILRAQKEVQSTTPAELPKEEKSLVEVCNTENPPLDTRRFFKARADVTRVGSPCKTLPVGFVRRRETCKDST